MQTATTQLTPLVNSSRAARRAEKQAEYVARQAALKKQREQWEARQAALKEKMAQQAAQKQEPKKPALKQETVKMRDGSKFVVIFSLPRRHIPDGLQVLHMSGGTATYAPPRDETPQDVRFSKADIDLDGLMQRVSVDVINVCQGERNFCRVYVNCTVGVGGKHQGFNAWKGPYEDFVRENVGQVWSRAIVKHAADKTSFELRKPVKDAAETKVRFAIER